MAEPPLSWHQKNAYVRGSAKTKLDYFHPGSLSFSAGRCQTQGTPDGNLTCWHRLL